MLPSLFEQRPTLQGILGKIYDTCFHSLELDPKYSPRRSSMAVVSVVNVGALDAALAMAERHAEEDGQLRMPCTQRNVPWCNSANGFTPQASEEPVPIAILNVVSDNTPDQTLGGRWLEGSLATEEEELCFRSSLHLSFPMSQLHTISEAERGPATASLSLCQALYTPHVLVVRAAREMGYALLATDDQDTTVPQLPIVSVISVAPPPQNQTGRGVQTRPDCDSTGCPDTKYDDAFSTKPLECECIKNRMRMVLRIAACNGHQSLVLGTMGYGAQSRDDPSNVIACWLEVLDEPEFFGRGWWRDLCFAVSDRWNGEGQYALFKQVLEGYEV